MRGRRFWYFIIIIQSRGMKMLVKISDKAMVGEERGKEVDKILEEKKLLHPIRNIRIAFDQRCQYDYYKI